MIIGICGPIGCGKSTAAKYLINAHKFTRVPFAGPLKDMAKAIGLTEEQVNGDQKQVPSDLICGKTPREFMQLIGTEFGRKMIGPDIWVNAWKARTYHENVVADDVRFHNEVDAIHELGGVVIRITRHHGLPDVKTAHESEAHLASLKHDFEVINHGNSLVDFHFHFANLYSELRRGK